MITRRRTALLSVWCCVPLVTAACGDESAGEPIAQPAASTPTTSSPTPPEATMPTIDPPSASGPANTPSPSSNLEIAMADLRTRVGAEVEIEVISNEEVTWSDGGLGCPEPGMSYTQALVNGERIVLRANGVDYEYHSDKSGPAFFCPPDRLTPPVTGSYGKM